MFSKKAILPNNATEIGNLFHVRLYYFVYLMPSNLIYENHIDIFCRHFGHNIAILNW